MLTTMHLLVGAVIGKYIGNIWLIIIFALISHYILDFIPHTSMIAVKGYFENGLKGTDIKDLLSKSIEPFLGVILAIFLIYLNKGRAVPMIIGAFFAWFPDLLSFIVWKYRLQNFRKFLPRPGTIWYNKASSLIVGIGTQIIVFIASIWALIFNIKLR